MSTWGIALARGRGLSGDIISLSRSGSVSCLARVMLSTFCMSPMRVAPLGAGFLRLTMAPDNHVLLAGPSALAEALNMASVAASSNRGCLMLPIRFI